jgi:hypothetical protein
MIPSLAQGRPTALWEPIHRRSGAAPGGVRYHFLQRMPDTMASRVW